MYESLLEHAYILVFIVASVLALALALFEGLTDIRLKEQETSERKPSQQD